MDPETPIDLVPARFRSVVYAVAALTAAALVVVEVVTGVDALDLIGRGAALLVALLAVLHRPTRGA